MAPTPVESDDVRAVLDALTEVLGNAVLEALKAARKEQRPLERAILVAPPALHQWLSIHGGGTSFEPIDYDQDDSRDSTHKTPIEEVAAHLQKHSRRGAVDLFVAFHPAHRITPAPWQRSFHLSSVLEREDRVWIIRPQSFFLQLLDDEYVIFPEKEDASWRSAADIWWAIRNAYREYKVPFCRDVLFRRGITSSGWVELAAHLVQSLFDPSPHKFDSPRKELKCSLFNLMRRFFVLQEALTPLDSLKLTIFSDDELAKRKDFAADCSFKCEASIIRFTLTPPTLLLANLVETFSEQRECAESPGDLAPTKQQTDVDNTFRRLSLFFPRSPKNLLSRAHSQWLEAHNPSFALVRWDPPANGKPPDPVTEFADPEDRVARGTQLRCRMHTKEVQKARMDWYKAHLESRIACGSPVPRGFTDSFQRGGSSYWNVGVNYEDYAAGASQQMRQLRPWIMTTDCGPFRDALKTVREVLTKYDTYPIDGGFQHGLDEAIRIACAESKQEPNQLMFYRHYLLWYYEYFLRFEVESTNQKAALDRVRDSFIPALVFHERHFYAFKAPVASDLDVTDGAKFVTLSIGLDGDESASSADIRMMHRIVDKLAQLRAYDKAAYRERELRHEAQLARTGRMEDLARTLTHSFQKTADHFFTVTKKALQIPDDRFSEFKGRIFSLNTEARIQADLLRMVKVAAHGALETSLYDAFARAWGEYRGDLGHSVQGFGLAPVIGFIAAAYNAYRVTKDESVARDVYEQFKRTKAGRSSGPVESSDYLKPEYREHAAMLLREHALVTSNLDADWFYNETFLIIPTDSHGGQHAGKPEASIYESIWWLVFLEIFRNVMDGDELKIDGSWQTDRLRLVFRTQTTRTLDNERSKWESRFEEPWPRAEEMIPVPRPSQSDNGWGRRGNWLFIEDALRQKYRVSWKESKGYVMWLSELELGTPVCWRAAQPYVQQMRGRT